MAEKKLYDNLFKVIKGNSGGIGVGSPSNVSTEILDLQIPRGYVARVRKVIAQLRNVVDDNIDSGLFDWMVRAALVADPDDENSVFIPTFNVDHDVICDFQWSFAWNVVGTAGGFDYKAERYEIDFPEELDVVTVRNLRFNVYGVDLLEETALPQVDVEVYFTYEKVSADLYAKLLGIS